MAMKLPPVVTWFAAKLPKATNEFPVVKYRAAAVPMIVEYVSL